ncbi:MAG: DNA polymerase III subunit gamma/tau [Bacteroidia bacterium]|nr:DNA polymerase III subunit gamma/tau [Bacteroidia bacterium]
MENTSNNTTYIVSARKYRPQSFETIVGQEHVTNTLKNAILTQKIAQAYLFFGPRGVGKTTCARVFAKTINCLNLQPNGEACNECASCKAFNSNTSFNIYELDAASNNSVEDIRQLIDQVRYPPQLGKYKVYIIDEVHMLSTAAFNAFLKTLEEPPPYAKFILATTEKNKVLPTILSRCQVFNFNRIKTEDITRYLEKIAVKENHQYELEALRIIAEKADGGLRDACSIYDQMAAFTQGNITKQAVIENLHVLDYDYYFQLTEAFLNQDHTQILLLLDSILTKGFDPQNVLVGLIDHLRYLLLAKDPQTTILMDMSDSAREAILQQSRKCNERFLLNALSILNKADINFRSSRHQRLHLEIHLLQIAHLSQSLADAEKKNLNEPSPSQNPNVSTSSKETKGVKVSEKPILNQVIVKTTASISSFKQNTNTSETNYELKHTEFKTQTEISPSFASTSETISNSSSSVKTELPTQSSSLPQNEYTENIIKDEIKDTSIKYTESTSDQTNPNIPKEDNKKTNTSISNNSGVQNITEKRYTALINQNPLLEELRVRLNLEFK